MQARARVARAPGLVSSTSRILPLLPVCYVNILIFHTCSDVERLVNTALGEVWPYILKYMLHKNSYGKQTNQPAGSLGKNLVIISLQCRSPQPFFPSDPCEEDGHDLALARGSYLCSCQTPKAGSASVFPTRAHKKRKQGNMLGNDLDFTFIYQEINH